MLLKFFINAKEAIEYNNANHMQIYIINSLAAGRCGNQF